MIRNLWLPAALFTLCALTLPLIAAAQTTELLLAPIFPKNTVFRQVKDVNIKVPLKQNIPGIADSQHGTYQRQPYYVFIDDAKTGEKWLISDSQLKIALTLIPGSAGTRPQSSNSTLVFRTAKYSGKATRSEYLTTDVKDLVISINDPKCLDQTCFRVSGTGNYPDLPSGDNQFTIYVPDTPRPDGSGPPISWGSTFSNKPDPPLSYMYLCWNIKKLYYADYQHATCQKELLSLPGPNSHYYRAVSGHLSLPWGWLYAQNDHGSGNSYSRMMTTGKEVAQGLQRTAGYNVSGKLVADVLDIVDASSSFTFKRNDSISKEFSKMDETKTVFTENQYYQTEYAIVVDKINGGLNPNFRQAVKTMVPQYRNGTLTYKILKDFIKEWGTHYAYAVTYGTQGTATFTLNESQVVELYTKGVNLSEAWSADASITFFGVGGEIGGGSDNTTDKKQHSEFKNIVLTSKETYQCSGGASCEGGKPSATPLVPVYLDLRPISELLAPPYYPFYKDGTDTDIMLGLRDAMQKAIFKYAFLKNQDTGSAIRVVEMTFDEPLCDGQSCTQKYPDSTWQWEVLMSLSPPGMSFSAKNADVSISPNPRYFQTYKFNFDTGQPTFLLVASAQEVNAELSGLLRLTLNGQDIYNLDAEFARPNLENDLPLMADGTSHVVLSYLLSFPPTMRATST